MSFWDTASAEVLATAFASALALVAVWIPFWRGLRVALRAHAATRRPGEQSPGGNAETLSALLLHVLGDSLRGHMVDQPSAFLRDASKQFVIHEYEANYERPLSMYANLLPPIGFIGTTLGLMLLFASMQLSESALEVGALGLALTSTLFALASFAVLEALKISLYGRLLRSVDEALEVPDQQLLRDLAEAEHAI